MDNDNLSFHQARFILLSRENLAENSLGQNESGAGGLLYLGIPSPGNVTFAVIYCNISLISIEKDKRYGQSKTKSRPSAAGLFGYHPANRQSGESHADSQIKPD